MKQNQPDYEELLEKVVSWARTRPDIHMALVVGSRARTDHPADDWADLDIMLFSTNPKLYLSQPDWLARIGDVWAQTRHRTVSNDAEWLVTFEGGLDVDFVFSAYPKTQWQVMLWFIEHFPQLKRFIPRQAIRQLQLSAQVLGRGVRMLIDKDKLGMRMQSFMTNFMPGYQPPDQAEFAELVQHFWCLAEKTAKKIGRGEFYVAIAWCHYIHESAVLPMLEWHAHALHQGDQDTWHGGRFLEEWVDRRALDGMARVFPHYGKKDIRDSLFATMDLFRWLAIETADHLHYPYPAATDENISTYVRKMMS